MGLDFIDAVIERFNCERTCFSPHELSGAIYSIAHEKTLTESQRHTLVMEVAPWEFDTREDCKSCWGTYYAPMAEVISGDGTRVVRPDLSALGSDALTLWAGRVKEVTHPAMVVRYSDVLWDLTGAIDPAAPATFMVNFVGFEGKAEEESGTTTLRLIKTGDLGEVDRNAVS